MIDTLVIVLSGPGGVGKGAIARRLVERDPRLWLSRSWTTRPRRPGEDPDAYVFVDRAEFEAHLAEGGFLEWNEFLGNLYGTPMPPRLPDRDVLLEIDVNGAAQVARRMDDPLLIFVDAPSRSVQRERLEGRGDSADHVVERIEKAERERVMADELGALVVINDDLDAAVAEIERCIATARSG